LTGTEIACAFLEKQEASMAHDIAELELKVRALNDVISKFHQAKHVERLVQIIHRPGWTTPREEEFVRAYTDSLHGQISGLHKAFDVLLTIAEKVGTQE
jgi:hypothetical protein